jgi:very-short-patch-repair endonuclease
MLEASPGLVHTLRAEIAISALFAQSDPGSGVTMSDAVVGTPESAPEQVVGAEQDIGSGLLADTMQAALELAQSRLLDRSLRNKLINAPLRSSKARQVRVFDELSDQVFARLRSRGAFTFTAGRAAGEENQGQIWLPEEGADPDRHSDSKLQTQMTPEGLQKRLLSLYYEGRTLEEEQGVNVLFLALGFLEWREDAKSEMERFAPLLLLPVELIRDGARDRFKLQVRDDDLITNISLQAWLNEEFRVELPDIPEHDDWKPSTYFDAVAKAVEGRGGWRVHPNEMLLGFFSFSKFLLWRDLNPESWGDGLLLGNGLLKRLMLRDYGDDEIVDTPLIGDDERLEQAFPTAELVHVTDADSSQAIAIQEVLAGKNLVIQGPPGTGKSQTITNIVAGAVAGGKSVLFVAEKMAALDVVHDRLAAAKLGPICLELHSRKSSKASVLEQLRKGQTTAPPPMWAASAFSELEETQERLRSHSDLLHALDALGFSPFKLMGEISLLKGAGTPTPDFELPRAAEWTQFHVDEVRREALLVAGRLLTSGIPALHPWRGAGVPAPDPLARDRLRPLIARCRETATALVEQAETVRQSLLLPGDLTFRRKPAWLDVLNLLSGRPAGFDEVIVDGRWRDVLAEIDVAIQNGRRLAALEAVVAQAFRPTALEQDWSQSRVVLAGRGDSFFRLLSKPYRDAVAEVRGHWNGAFPKQNRIRLEKLDALIELQLVRAAVLSVDGTVGPALGSHWRGLQSDWARLAELAAWLPKLLHGEEVAGIRLPLLPPEKARSLAHRLQDAGESAEAAFGDAVGALQLDLRLAFEAADLSEIPCELLLTTAIQWSENFDILVDWTAARDGLSWLRQLGCSRLADSAYAGETTPAHLEPVLALAIFEAKWNRLRAEIPKLGEVLGDELNRLVERFRNADRNRIRLASDQVSRAHIDRRPTGSSGAMGVLADELRKHRNHLPVRKLMLTAGEAVQRIKPVFLMSPLSVAQYLQPMALEFDLLVIDEASQVRPEDALGAIARCKQIVVVGDDRQLPPTNFFNRTINDDDPDDDDDEAPEGAPRKAVIKDVESILNLCAPRFPARMLKWHYRSEHPALIATSNRNFYGGELMLPPSIVARTTDGETGLVFRPVPQGGYERGKTARNELEAGLIAQAALEHARRHPELSLGIGTFSVAQRDCVRDQIDDLARQHPELEAMMKPSDARKELFIKNLENIQGDERDVIFISVGYGHDANGKLTQNFGPVGRDGGERRLNVLITRARKRCEVFSSIVAEDIRLDGAGKPGVRALKEFLKLAKDGYAAVAMETERGFDSPFEEDVAQAVRGLGYDVRPQVGMAGFFIDLAVIDPRDEGRYLLGIECDGAAYHSSRYARDRDRLRQMILENRGWSLHRIWSTDWFYKREREIEKLRGAIRGALAGELPTNSADNEPAEPDEDDESEAGDNAWDEGADQSQGPHRLDPYVKAEFRVSQGAAKPQDFGLTQVAAWMRRIVEQEQPIHSEEAGRRLAAICGLQRAGNVIQQTALRALRHCERSGELSSEGDFWSLPGATIFGRDRGQLAAADTLRKPALIAPVEFEAVALHALQENLSMTEEELIIETARLLGFARTGSDVRSAIKGALAERLLPHLARDHLGRLKAPA